MTLPTKLTFTDATEKVLNEFGNNDLMHYRVITEKAIDSGWIVTDGKTPELSLYSSVFQEIKRQKDRGEVPRFVLHRGGFISLFHKLPPPLIRQIQQHNEAIRKKMIENLRKMPPEAFEALIGELLVAMGFEAVSVTGKIGDHGIDVIGNLVVDEVVHISMAVQVKKWTKNNIGEFIVRDLRGSLDLHQAGAIITVGKFTKGALASAKKPTSKPIDLINGEQLVNLLVKYEIGVSHGEPYHLLEIVTDESNITST